MCSKALKPNDRARHGFPDLRRAIRKPPSRFFFERSARPRADRDSDCQAFQAADKSILLPAPAAWEYVLDFPIREQSAVWKALSGFSIVPFDAAAAARIAARISRQHYDTTPATSPPTIGARQQIKVDIQILAVAIAQRADAILTLEVEKFSRWSGGAIPVAGIPRAA